LGEGSLIDRLNMIDAQLRHEDDLIGLRMSWLVISQPFLFGTFATLVGLRSVVGTAAGAVKLLLVLIPAVGVFLPVLVTALGHSLPIVASVGFLLAWLVILILVE
jgi:hypothetical protein